MADLAHGKFVRKLEYLAGKYGVKVQKVDRFFPSSKLCDCGYVYRDLTLHDREWTCPVCGLHHDRDLHAACNILRQGIASLGNPGKTREPGKVTVRGISTQESRGFRRGSMSTEQGTSHLSRLFSRSPKSASIHDTLSAGDSSHSNAILNHLNEPPRSESSTLNVCPSIEPSSM